MNAADVGERRVGRSILAVLAGLVFVIVSSTLTDVVLHLMHVYPPWTEPMRDPGLNALALAYRTVYTVIGGFLTARLAPRAAMFHAWVLAGIGQVLGLVGIAIGAMADLGPMWYPVALAALAIPSTWLGGFLFVRRPR